VISALSDGASRFLRGRACGRIVAKLGIDPQRYWLLMDLFDELSERREMMAQLGRNGVALKSVAWLYFALAALFAIFFVLLRPPLETYLWRFLGMTAFLLFTILLSETSNSLVNPEEGAILAHQPVNGATYTAAKLSHLLRIVVYLAAGLNAVPALAGLAWEGAGWWYPPLHLSAAIGVGLIAALLCCAIFGWLIRFVPAPRLKAAGQVAELMPWMGFLLIDYGEKPIRSILSALGSQPARAEYLAWAACAAVAAVAVFGLRCLSRDYLIEVSGIVHGGSKPKRMPRRARLGAAVAFLCGGPASRGGFEYIRRMMPRDWHFRRQMIPILPVFIAPAALLMHDIRTTPFSGSFTGMHVTPHVFGIVLFWMCTLLPYGNDYKGVWIFLAAPSRQFSGFARGVHAFFWFEIVLIPHAILFLILAWAWGISPAGVFIVFSAAVASTYAGLTLRLIDGVPFGKQPEPAQGPMLMGIMIVGGISIAIAVAAQYFFIFRSVGTVLVFTAFLAAVAWLIARSSLRSFEAAMRYHLSQVTRESGSLYVEV
jgi:hypothetical protein